jgi:hypothetical protein
MYWNMLIIAIEAILVFMATLCIVNKYADRQRTPFVVKAATVMGWFAGFSMIVFVPLDIYVTLTKSGGDNAAYLLTVWWTTYYWSSFILNWTIFPFMIGWLESGSFTNLGRLWSGFIHNVPIFSFFLLAFVGLCSLLYFTN